MNKYKKIQKANVEEFPNRTHMFEPLITVCVFAYNHESYIQKCLDGILKQKTNFIYEIYLGEDDSDDITRKICIEYAKNYPDKIRLFLHNKENKLFINGRKSGRFNLLYSLNISRGKYIALCDGDDYWTGENKLQEQVTFLENNPDFSMVFSNVQNVDTSGKAIGNPFLNYSTEIFTHDTFAGCVSAPTLTTVFRKDALPSSFPDEFYRIVNADMFLKTMISEKGKIKYFNKITGNKRIHAGGIYDGISFVKREEGKLGTQTAMLNYFTSAKVKQNLKKSIAKTYSRLLYNYLKEKNFYSFAITLSKAIRFHVVNLQGLPMEFYYSQIRKKL